MKWIFYSLLLANLVNMALSLWAQKVGGGSATENAGNIAFRASSCRDSGFEQKGANMKLSSGALMSSNRTRGEMVLKQPTLVAAADEFKSCLGLGPFENVISVQRVAKRLKAIGYNIEMTAVDTRTGESDYRVMMPSLGSQQEAFRRFRELKSRGIDSFVITKGLDAGGISLGVFASNEPAEDYREKLIGLGYKVLLDVLPRVNRSYWIQISQEMFPEKFLLNVAAEFIGVEVTETGCMN